MDYRTDSEMKNVRCGGPEGCGERRDGERYCIGSRCGVWAIHDATRNALILNYLAPMHGTPPKAEDGECLRAKLIKIETSGKDDGSGWKQFRRGSCGYITQPAVNCQTVAAPRTGVALLARWWNTGYSIENSRYR